jgi:glyoxylase-like metal-dependent hydrolase (beta-lactamase superfamily II)
VFWIDEHRALVPGDVLLGAADGGVRRCPDSWLPEGTTGEDLRRSLRPLLDLPIELVLVSHGRPVLANGRDVLAAGLA